MFHVDGHCGWGVRVSEEEYRRLDPDRRLTFGSCGKLSGNMFDPCVAVVDVDGTDAVQEAGAMEAILRADGRVFFFVADASWAKAVPCCGGGDAHLNAPEPARAVAWAVAHCRDDEDALPPVGLADQAGRDVRYYVIVTEADADVDECRMCYAAVRWGETSYVRRKPNDCAEICVACAQQLDPTVLAAEYDEVCRARPKHLPWLPWKAEDQE
jgi:hypothetical protein